MCMALCLFAFPCFAQTEEKGHKTPEEQQWEAMNAEQMQAYRAGKYREGIALAEKAYKFAKEKFGKTDQNTLISMNNLGELYRSMGRYSEAEPLYKEALQLLEKVMGKEHPYTLTSINNLAALYHYQGSYGKAEPLYKEALQLCEKLLEKEHPNYIGGLDNIAELYLNYMGGLNNLAGLYHSQGRYSEAEPLYKEALQLCEKLLGKEHPGTLISINNLARLYHSQGRYGEAEPLLKEALQLGEKVLGKEHPDTLTSINNLAALYSKQGRYGEAESLYKKALQLCEKVLGKEHPDTLTSISSLAGLYHYQGRYSEAEPLLKEALQLGEKVLGKEHPDTLISIHNLALLYEAQGRYSEAEPLYKQALQLSEKVLGKEHPNTLEFHTNYIFLMMNMKKHSLAFRLLKQAEGRLFSRSFQELYTTSEEKIRRLFLKNISKFQDITFTLAAQHPEPEYVKYAAEVLLRWKQVYAEENAFQHRLLCLSKDPEIMKLRQETGQLREKFSRKIHRPEFRAELPEIWFHLNAAEQEVRNKARQFKPELQVSTADADQLISRLPKESGLVEFRVFNPVDFKTGERPSEHLAAYLLIPDIEAEQQIWFEDLGDIAEFFKTFAEQENKADSFYNFLFAKFDKQIRNLKQIYIAPDGFLSLISFASLKLPDGKYFAQHHQINQLQTGRDLLANTAKNDSSLLVAFGGVEYGKADEKAQEKPDDDTPKHLNMRAARELKNLTYLKHSFEEAARIAEIFKTNTKGKTLFFSKSEATEKNLKNLPAPPRILHLSTHGFYLQNAELTDWAEEAPLLLSGLALSGANEGLQGKLDANGDDGLLYSMEVLGLNLQGTELVSLSACDTGKGVVDYSEGVYGLVRAFRTAGAQSVLMTLWPVGDESSRVFMESFYDIWLSSENLTPAEALHKTRLRFIENPPKPGYDNPAVWSPYVLVGR